MIYLFYNWELVSLNPLHPFYLPTSGNHEFVSSICERVSVLFCLFFQYHSFSTHLPIEGHLGCFQIWAIMNEACINIHIWIYIFYFSGVNIRSWISDIVTNCSTIFQGIDLVLKLCFKCERQGKKYNPDAVCLSCPLKKSLGGESMSLSMWSSLFQMVYPYTALVSVN